MTPDDTDTLTLFMIIACGFVSSAVRRKRPHVAALTCCAFVALYLLLFRVSLRDPELSWVRAIASIIFVVVVPTIASFAAARLEPLRIRPQLAGVAAILAHVAALFFGLVFAVNTGLLVP